MGKLFLCCGCVCVDNYGDEMNKRIKELTDEAGLFWQFSPAYEKCLEHFAKLVRADEREACAITAWSIGIDLHLKHHDIREVGSACATAIRARGNHDTKR